MWSRPNEEKADSVFIKVNQSENVITPVEVGVNFAAFRVPTDKYGKLNLIGVVVSNGGLILVSK